MPTVLCWLRRFREMDYLFSCEQRIKKKKNAKRAPLSIHLFIRLSFRLLGLSVHIPRVPPRSSRPFIAFPCPAPFWLLPCSFILPLWSFSSLLLRLLGSRLILRAPGHLCLPAFLVVPHLAFSSPPSLQAGPGGMQDPFFCFDVVTSPVSVTVTLSAKLWIFPRKSKKRTAARHLPVNVATVQCVDHYIAADN